MIQEKQTIFNFLDSINEKKRLNINEKDFSNYMVSLWLSHAGDVIEFVNDMNPYIFSIPKEALYEYYFSIIPKKKRFIKFTKKDVPKTQSLEMKKLKEKMNLSDREVMLYKDLL